MARIEREHDLRAGADPPLFVGRVQGLRGWSIEFDEDGQIRLAAPFRDVHWERGGAPTAAICMEGSWPRRHEPPGKWCDCGLYGLHPSAQSAAEVMRECGPGGWPFQLCGVVEAWGRVEVHEAGFRAELARPLVLVVSRGTAETDWGKLIQRAAGAHGADALELDSPEELVEHCRSHNLGLSEGAVADLVQVAEQEPVGVSSTARSTGGGAGGSQPKPRRGVGDLASMAVGVLAGVVGVAFWLAVWAGLAFVILGAIFGWFGDGDPSATARADPHLEVVDQAVLDGDRGPVYVAAIGNDDPRRAALGVRPRLRLASGSRLGRFASAGRFDQPANVPPGGTAVAVDRLRADPTGRLGAPQFEVASFRRAPRFPIEHVHVRPGPGRCALSAEITTRESLDRLKLIGLARRGGRIVGGDPFRLDRVPRGHSTQELARLPKALCGLRPARWSLYPALSPRKGGWRNSAAAR